METNKFFSKLNIKDYNNELETILEKKSFSFDVKNLLLSMLYKIESLYKDYITVKVEVLSKKDFIEYILKVIKEDCFTIKFINLESEDKPRINIEKGEIICYPNEKSLLSSIWYMGEKEIEIKEKYNYERKALNEMLKIGNNQSEVEVLRDFSGWSWDIDIKEIENIDYNIVYQNLLLLKGKEILYYNINNNEEKSTDEIFLNNNNEYKEFIKIIKTIVINNYIQRNPEYIQEISDLKREKEKELSLIENKKEFVEKITNDKKNYSKRIEEIDKIINSTELLKIEYEKINKELLGEEKIFSVSHLSERLEKERKEILDKMQELNKMLSPKEFIKLKDRIIEEVEYIEEVILEDNKLIDECKIKLCKQFLKIAEKQIKNLKEKQDIIKWIYKIRYYSYIPYNNEVYLKDVQLLENEFEKTIKTLIRIAQKNKVLDIFSENEEAMYKIVKELLNSKMINLENTNIVCRYDNGMLYVEYYDSDVLEMKKEYEVENIRIKKKIKLFM